MGCSCERLESGKQAVVTMPHLWMSAVSALDRGAVWMGVRQGPEATMREASKPTKSSDSLHLLIASVWFAYGVFLGWFLWG